MNSPLESTIPLQCIATFRRIVRMVDSIDPIKHKLALNQVEIATAVSQIMKLPLCDGAKSHNINDVFVKLRDNIIVDVYCHDRLPMVQLARVSPDDIKEHDESIAVDTETVGKLIKIMRQPGYSLAKPIQQ